MTTARPLEQIPAPSVSLNAEASVNFPTEQIVTGQAKVGDTLVNYTASVGGAEIVVIVPGLMGNETFSSPLRNQLALLGYTAISYEAARSRRSKRATLQDIRQTAHDMFNPSSLHLDTLTAVIDNTADNKALRNTRFGPTLKFDTVRLDPHSMGAHSASHYALRHPTEVSSTVMLAPHGLEKFLALHLLRRSGMVVKDELVPFLTTHRAGLLPEIVPAIFSHAVANPIRLVCEGLSCVVDTSKLERSSLTSCAGNVAIVGFPNDKIINTGSLARATKLHNILFELHPDARAGHFAPYTHAPTVAELAVEMHRQLEFPPPALVTT